MIFYYVRYWLLIWIGCRVFLELHCICKMSWSRDTGVFRNGWVYVNLLSCLLRTTSTSGLGITGCITNTLSRMLTLTTPPVGSSFPILVGCLFVNTRMWRKKERSWMSVISLLTPLFCSRESKHCEVRENIRNLMHYLLLLMLSAEIFS